MAMIGRETFIYVCANMFVSDCLCVSKSIGLFNVSLSVMMTFMIH